MAESKIEWTNETWNPVRGCTITSPGCKNCYAMKIAHRFSGPGGKYEGLTKLHKKLGPIWTGEVRAIDDTLDAPLCWRKPRRVFVNSMSDLFHEGLRDEDIEAVFGVMHAASQHTYQVLTKRADRMRDFMRTNTAETCLAEFVGRNIALASAKNRRDRFEKMEEGWPWPPPNVWLGVSVEDQRRAEERIPALLETPAAVRFLSIEPMLGEIDLRRWLHAESDRRWNDCACSGEFAPCETCNERGPRSGIDWVIVGGESGNRARPADVIWVETIVRDCKGAGVPVFVKQLGAKPYDSRESDRTTDEPHPLGPAFDLSCRLHITHRKGGDMDEWRECLRVREFPDEVARG